LAAVKQGERSTSAGLAGLVPGGCGNVGALITVRWQLIGNRASWRQSLTLSGRVRVLTGRGTFSTPGCRLLRDLGGVSAWLRPVGW
jgi:hypothetical protein